MKKIKQCVKYGFIASSVMILSACNGGGSSGPTSSSNYGQVNSIVQQNFAGMQNIPLSALNAITLQAGKYVESSDYQYPTFNIASTLESYNYNVESMSNYALNGITSVSAYSITYNTPGQNANTDPNQIVRDASGLIIVPNTSNIRGVVIYFHPTTFGKNQVPSCIKVSTSVQPYCIKPNANDATGTGNLAMLSSVFASRGFIVVAPDYVGQGNDWNNVHPYVVYPENNALSAFYMLPAMRQIMKQKGISEYTTLPLFITGYSEGGGYALKASQMAQNDYASYLAQNKLTLKMTSPQEGAYSLVDQMNFGFTNLNDGVFNCANVTDPSFKCGQSPAMESNDLTINPIVDKSNSWHIGSAAYAAAGKPALSSYVLTAAMYYSFHNLSTAYNFAMNNQFWADVTMPDGTVATLYDLYSGVYGQKYTGDQISSAIVANTMKINSYDLAESYPIAIYMSDAFYNALYDPTYLPIVNPLPYLLPKQSVGYGLNNQGTSFINSGITTNPDFQSILTSGSTYNWHTNSPINFIHMNYDSLVTVLNSHQAYSCMKYGKSFAGNEDTIASAAPCSTTASPGMVEDTKIQNFQMTNNLVQLGTDAFVYSGDYADLGSLNGYAISKFWSASMMPSTGIYETIYAITGTPFDHGDMYVLGSIIALCTFENQLADGSNSGVCPAL